jgi:hypothetical protein
MIKTQDAINGSKPPKPSKYWVNAMRRWSGGVSDLWPTIEKY